MASCCPCFYIEVVWGIMHLLQKPALLTMMRLIPLAMRDAPMSLLVKMQWQRMSLHVHDDDAKDAPSVFS